jgi:hypothetical protein
MSTYYPIHSTSPARRTNVAVKSRYSLYKGDLREDFASKCGYCDTADFYSGGRRGFHIDHFAPKSKFGALQNTYSNLVYCCPTCNIGKSDDWPGSDSAVSYVGNIGYVDPCHSDYPTHLARGVDGKIFALTPLGDYIHRKLKLHLRRRQICWLLERVESQLAALRGLVEKNGYVVERAEIKALCDLQRAYFEYLGILKRE